MTMLIVAVVVTLIFVVLALMLPHPSTWIAAAVMVLVTSFLIWPKYKHEQAAMAYGVEVPTYVDNVRSWQRKKGDDLITRYEIYTVWENPETRQMIQFRSDPIDFDPEPYLPKTITVKVIPEAPENYVMDLSFLPAKAPY
ncbi:MAG: hypothetical protein KA214_01605 [Neisseriaceae bacterium]|nr:hypothetical protein [Neisseriaceae bacterium]